jgi:hypothetical protein
MQIDQIAWLRLCDFRWWPWVVGALVKKKKSNEAVIGAAAAIQVRRWVSKSSDPPLTAPLILSTSGRALAAFVSTMRFAEVAAD